MKKLLLVSIILVVGVFLYQNVEINLLNLLSQTQKNLLLKEINIANQFQQQQYKEFINEYSDSNGENDLIENTHDKTNQTNESNKTSASNNGSEINPQPQPRKPTAVEQIKENSLIEATPTNTSKLDVLALLQKVSFEDQIKVANILLKHFTFSELNSYRTMVSNGISEQEKVQIKEEVLSRLTEDDLVLLKEIAEEYVVENYPEQQERLNNLANRYLQK